MTVSPILLKSLLEKKITLLKFNQSEVLQVASVELKNQFEALGSQKIS